MEEDKNGYMKVLGLVPGMNYTTTEIKKAWRKGCLKNHPDQGGSAEEFQKITHAYKMLTDTSYRHQRDIERDGPKGGLDINLTIPINFEDAFFGREILISYNTVELSSDGNPIADKEFEVYCEKVAVPSGGFNFSKRLKGKGLKRGDQCGDALVNFQAIPHKKFKMNQNRKDVVTTESVPLDILLRGGVIEVMTLWGLRTAKIPPGSKDGDSIYVQNCGIREAGRHQVILKSVYPTKEELKKNSNWRGLNIDWSLDEEEGDGMSDQDKEFEQIFVKILGDNGTGGAL